MPNKLGRKMYNFAGIFLIKVMPDYIIMKLGPDN